MFGPTCPAGRQANGSPPSTTSRRASCISGSSPISRCMIVSIALSVFPSIFHLLGSAWVSEVGSRCRPPLGSPAAAHDAAGPKCRFRASCLVPSRRCRARPKRSRSRAPPPWRGLAVTKAGANLHTRWDTTEWSNRAQQARHPGYLFFEHMSSVEEKLKNLNWPPREGSESSIAKIWKMMKWW